MYIAVGKTQIAETVQKSFGWDTWKHVHLRLSEKIGMLKFCEYYLTEFPEGFYKSALGTVKSNIKNNRFIFVRN